MQGLPGPAYLDARHDLRHSVDHGEQSEQQREGDRADPGTGSEHHPERDRDQPGHDEHRPGTGGLAPAEGGEDLGEAGHERPDRHDQHQHPRGRVGPDQGSHTGRQVDQCQQQVAEDRSCGAAAERAHGLQARADEGVDREQDDQRGNRHARPGDGDDPDDDAQDAKQDQ